MFSSCISCSIIVNIPNVTYRFWIDKTNVTNGSMNSINRLQLWNKWIIVKSEFNFHYHHNWIKWNELDIQNMLDDKICWISWQNRLDMKLTKLTNLTANSEPNHCWNWIWISSKHWVLIIRNLEVQLIGLLIKRNKRFMIKQMALYER